MLVAKTPDGFEYTVDGASVQFALPRTNNTHQMGVPTVDYIYLNAKQTPQDVAGD